MLIIQIAAGIVLAVAILVYHKHLFAIGRVLGALLLGAIFIGLLIWGVTEGTDAAVTHSDEIFEKLRTVGVVIFVYLCGAAGGYGLWILLSVICKFHTDKLNGSRFGIMSAANAILVWLVGWGLSAFTPFGKFADGIERWSREAGYTDTGSMILFSFGLLWTCIPLSLRYWRLVSKQRNTSNEVPKQ